MVKLSEIIITELAQGANYTIVDQTILSKLIPGIELDNEKLLLIDSDKYDINYIYYHILITHMHPGDKKTLDNILVGYHSIDAQRKISEQLPGLLNLVLILLDQINKYNEEIIKLISTSMYQKDLVLLTDICKLHESYSNTIMYNICDISDIKFKKNLPENCSKLSKQYLRFIAFYITYFIKTNKHRFDLIRVPILDSVDELVHTLCNNRTVIKNLNRRLCYVKQLIYETFEYF